MVLRNLHTANPSGILSLRNTDLGEEGLFLTGIAGLDQPHFLPGCAVVLQSGKQLELFLTHHNKAIRTPRCADQVSGGQR